MMDMLQIDIRNIYKVFNGMEEEYDDLIRNLSRELKDQTRNYDYKVEKKENAVKDVIALKNKYVEKALSDLKVLWDKYSIENKPKPKTELEALKDMILYSNILNKVDKETFNKIYDKNKHDEDFMLLAENLYSDDKKRKGWLMEAMTERVDYIQEIFEREEIKLKALTGLGTQIMILQEDGSIKNISHNERVRKIEEG